MNSFYGISIAALLSLTACAHNNANDKPAAIVGDSAEVDAVIPSSEPEIEAVNVFKPKIQKINKELYYKASCKQVVYATAKYDFDWPVEAPGFDIAPLQRDLIALLGGRQGTGIQSLINTCGYDFFCGCGGDELTWTKVETRGETLEPAEEGDRFFWGEPEHKMDIEFLGVDAERHLARFAVSLYAYTGSGVGAGILYFNQIAYYLYDEQRMMTVFDVVTPQAKKSLLRRLNSSPINIDDYGCLNGTPIEELPDNFFIEKGVIYFTFPKYEIACGADGNVTLGVRLSSLKEYLTPLGETFLSSQ